MTRWPACKPCSNESAPLVRRRIISSSGSVERARRTSRRWDTLRLARSTHALLGGHAWHGGPLFAAKKTAEMAHRGRTGSSSSKTDEIYTTLRFSFHSLRVHSVDIEWLLSTLVSTPPCYDLEPPTMGGFFSRVATLH